MKYYGSKINSCTTGTHDDHVSTYGEYKIGFKHVIKIKWTSFNYESHVGIFVY